MLPHAPLQKLAILVFIATACMVPGKAAVRIRTVAVIHSEPFHREVLTGVLTVLAPMINHTTVYLSPTLRPGGDASFGWHALLERNFTYAPLPTVSEAAPDIHVPLYDALIFISPEYSERLTKAFIFASKPSQVVLFVHHGDSVNLTQLPYRTTNTTKKTLITLSPHVAARLKARVGGEAKVRWMNPTARLASLQRCSDVGGAPGGTGSTTIGGSTGYDGGSARAVLGGNTAVLHGGSTVLGGGSTLMGPGNAACVAGVSGFAVQGCLSPRQRNYAGLWDEMLATYQDSKVARSDPRFKLCVLGSSDAVALPTIPEPLKAITHFHVNLPCVDYYHAIQHTYALVPLFVNGTRYLTDEASSTVATSLITGVPLIATEQMLEAYSFLNFEAVFLQQLGESAAAVMLRILAMPPDHVWRTRQALRQLRIKLNRQAQAQLLSIITGSEQRLKRLGRQALRRQHARLARHRREQEARRVAAELAQGGA